MSQEITIEEEDTASRVSQEIENGTRYSFSRRSQRAPSSDEENNRAITCLCCVTKRFVYVKYIILQTLKIYQPNGPLQNSLFLMLCTVSVLLEPLFLYTPVINDGKKCFKLGKALGIFAVVYRSVTDFIYLLYAFLQCRCTDSHENIVIRLLFFQVDLFTILPLPQILVILMFIPRTRGRILLLAMNFFMGQHVLRVLRLYTLFTKAKTTGNLARWAKVAFNLSYFHASHVIGAIWYFFAIERKTECWRKACMNHTECDNLSFYCDGSSGNYTFSNEFCSTKTQSMSTYDFGIFRDAIHSGVVEEANLFLRFIACFRWGLQNLSYFGQGLPLSTNKAENIFALSITISGVVLFFFLIGKVQMYVQSETVKSEEIRQKVWEINRWRPFVKLPQELQEQIKRCQSYKWRETRSVDVEYLVNNLPDNLKKNVKRRLCLDLLYHVEEFRSLGSAFVENLCNHVKPVMYEELSYVVRETDPIDRMVFVLEGKLWSYSSSGRAGSSSKANSRNNHLEAGDFCGQEVVDWIRRVRINPDSSNLDTSHVTIQALTKVEAFVLAAGDLKNSVTAHFANQSSSL